MPDPPEDAQGRSSRREITAGDEGQAAFLVLESLAERPGGLQQHDQTQSQKYGRRHELIDLIGRHTAAAALAKSDVASAVAAAVARPGVILIRIAATIGTSFVSKSASIAGTNFVSKLVANASTSGEAVPALISASSARAFVSSPEKNPV